jgi:hypothetical protein
MFSNLILLEFFALMFRNEYKLRNSLLPRLITHLTTNDPCSLVSLKQVRDNQVVCASGQVSKQKSDCDLCLRVGLVCPETEPELLL